MGTGEIGIPTLATLLDSKQQHEVVAVVTQPDRPAGRNLEVRPSPIKAFAQARDITVLQPEKLRTDAQPILALEPDLIVVMAYGQIVPKLILQLPKIACLNLHASLLPRHRGASPIHAALLAGDSETGVTVIYMDEGLDSGDILLKERIPIFPRETGGQLHDRLAQVAPNALTKALELLQQEAAPRSPQDLNLVTYAPKLIKENAALDWHRSAEDLDRQIRAMHPWPGTFCWWARKDTVPQRLRILEAQPRQGDGYCGRPGEILHVGEEGVEIQTSHGSLLLCQVQLEGRKPMAAAEFARGHPCLKGTFLK
ncbi:MAG: methionyl-tRNA formyltransferase [Verrucomicrobia bacterium]|nr:MAG: methionyl-tRNA formyltransferase [Verrucomicrobiota bacterium]